MIAFYFAWVDAGDTTFLSDYEREDLLVVAFDLTHEETKFASLKLTVKNPRIGLLNPGRKQWVWFSYNDGSTTHPLFFGRIVGVPDDLFGEAVTLEFIARPASYNQLKAELADTLREPPYWDPVFVAAQRRSDPDAVLDARSAAWHIDRVSHAVTISDIITGEDGTISQAGDFLYDTLKITYGQPPVIIRCEARVDWSQEARGVVDISRRVLAAARVAHSGDHTVISTYTGEGLATDWPKAGDDIGSGWKFGQSYVVVGNGRWISQNASVTVTTIDGTADFPLWSFAPKLKVKYDCKRSRSEIITFTVAGDLQDILIDPSGTDDLGFTQEVEDLQLSSAGDVAQPIDPPDDTDGNPTVMPIGDQASPTYFLTARGHQSFEYVLCLCRAHILSRARCVKVEAAIPFAAALGLTCRKNMQLVDARLPGGQATGKIIAYSLSGDGNGKLVGAVTLGCTPGHGATVTGADGTPDYVDDDYVDGDYQTRTDQLIMPITGEIVYADYSNQSIDDDGIGDFRDMSPTRVIRSIEVIDGKPIQAAVLALPWQDAKEAGDAVNKVSTLIDLKLVPLEVRPFVTTFFPAVGNLMIPKGIDLEAEGS